MNLRRCCSTCNVTSELRQQKYARPSKRTGHLFNFRGPSGEHLIDRRRLKERGVYSHNCNNLNKTNLLSAKIFYQCKSAFTGNCTCLKRMNNMNVICRGFPWQLESKACRTHIQLIKGWNTLVQCKPQCSQKLQETNSTIIETISLLHLLFNFVDRFDYVFRTKLLSVIWQRLQLHMAQIGM